jgi:8-oxo-dGTP pyrophosphatase MutT (NUDIX family)
VPTVDVAAGVVLRDGHVLVSRRRAEDHLGGFWEFPGGKIEPGETAPEAIVRELREELDVRDRTDIIMPAFDTPGSNSCIMHCTSKHEIRFDIPFERIENLALPFYAFCKQRMVVDIVEECKPVSGRCF